MKILVIGSQGFIGKNLVTRLKEFQKFEIIEANRSTDTNLLEKYIQEVDFIYHLAGVNRPQNEAEFMTGNYELTDRIVSFVKKSSKKPTLVFTSSIQVSKANKYGQSKLKSEESILSLAEAHPVYIYRLPNVFGKWSKPFYNSAVATFCHSIANDLPIEIHDENAMVNLVYIDDVVDSFVGLLDPARQPEVSSDRLCQVKPEYNTTVGELAQKIKDIKNSRVTGVSCPVGTGFWRALHATYLSFLKPEQFSYDLQRHADPRGVFVEFLKTENSGQFSFFTAGAGITRGGHYHHTKTEKFLILKGKAKYRFRHILTDEFYEIDVQASESRVIETVPGWTHDITNIGDSELIVMLWANEIFDREKPDTIGRKVI